MFQVTFVFLFVFILIITMARRQDLDRVPEEEIYRIIFEQEEPEEDPQNEGFGIEDEGSDIEDASTEVDTSSDSSYDESCSETSPVKEQFVRLLPRGQRRQVGVPEPGQSRGGPEGFLSRRPQEVVSPSSGQPRVEANPVPGSSCSGPEVYPSRQPEEVVSPSLGQQRLDPAPGSVFRTPKRPDSLYKKQKRRIPNVG